MKICLILTGSINALSLVSLFLEMEMEEVDETSQRKETTTVSDEECLMA